MYSQVVVNVPVLYDRVFTYQGEAPLGSLVQVPFGNSAKAALVVGHSFTTDIPDEIKCLGKALYAGAVWLSSELLSLADELAHFYLCPRGAIIDLMLPVPFTAKEVSGLKRVKREPVRLDETLTRHAPAQLTPEQIEAIEQVKQALTKGQAKPHLLYGVTGSGKTEVYLNAISIALSQGKQAIYLVPEIALTPQVIANVVHRFGEQVGVLHSGLSSGERARAWQKVLSGESQVVVGARSAVFAPTARLGLIIMDEEHEQSYRHEGGVNYHTRVVAQLRARQQGGVLLMGSATPSLEVYSSAERGGTKLLQLTARPHGTNLPEVNIVDMREELRQGRSGLLSSPLRQAVALGLQAGEQALLLFNRRGYAQMSLCRDCGHIPTCPHCDVSLRFHAGVRLLKCHYCGYSMRALGECPRCRGQQVHNRGAGTEKLAEELRALFPDFVFTRLDADTAARKGAHQKLLTEFGRQDSHILLGTKMIAKGLDFPRVTVAGVVDADSGMYYPDFRAVEESFALLMQVAGRSGRGTARGRVIIQTFNPEHYCLRLLEKHDYSGFYKVESRLRRKLSYPPFGGLATLCFRGRDQRRVLEAAQAVGELCVGSGAVVALGPVAEAPARVKDIYRYQLTLKAKNRKTLQELLADLRVRITDLCTSSARWYIILE
ncbi:MAG: Primosomal protein N' [Firmicutes bacterium]|nr:Primosomal protein N' [Bacillota bacterium]